MAINGAAALGVHAQQANRQGQKHQTRALAEAGMGIDGTGAAQGVHHAGQGAQHVQGAQQAQHVQGAQQGAHHVTHGQQHAQQCQQ